MGEYSMTTYLGTELPGVVWWSFDSFPVHQKSWAQFHQACYIRHPQFRSFNFWIMPFHLKFPRSGGLHQGTVTHRKDETYALLQHEPSEADSTDTIQSSPLPSYPLSAPNIIAVLLCIASAAVSWYLSITHPIISGSSSATDLRSVSREQYSTLRRPSPFIGFEGITRSSPPISRTLINYPATIALVNSSHPDQVFSDDPKQYMAPTGFVSPTERLVMLSNAVSFLQFPLGIIWPKAVDWNHYPI